jgi:hypothetical protein
MLQDERHRDQSAVFLYERRETGWTGQPEMHLLFGLADTSAATGPNGMSVRPRPAVRC